ncbi:MAG: hypothetical protein ACN4GW_20335 [Desulforhopalus sp.]
MIKEYDLSLSARGRKQPLSPGKLLSTETFLRLNPHWIVEELTEGTPSFSAQLKDHESGKLFSLSGTLVNRGGQIFEVDFESGDYRRITLFPQQDNLWARVEYSNPEAETPEDVERHVVLWLRSIKEYLRMYLTNSWNAIFFRYIMNKIILKMSPSQRKISLMLIRITIVEIFVILLIVVGYVIFVLKPLGSP